MEEYLEFKNAKCKDCYKCLRECPVKAIKVVDHQAKIIKERCILCGKCTKVCPQNAKRVHSSKDEVLELIRNNKKVVASIAPSFVSSFKVKDFSIMKIALCKLGFFDAEETSIGANVVVQEYEKLLKSGKYKNFITSACPAINRMIQIYYPNVLPYLAPVDTPAVVHAKMIKEADSDAKVVFIGPCIAKKMEGKESKVIDGVLTFEELLELFNENNIDLSMISDVSVDEDKKVTNRAKYFPISRGIIKSFATLPEGYEYIAIDGVERCFEVLNSMDELSGIFLEINSCAGACINGPCSLTKEKECINSNATIRSYVKRELENGNGNEKVQYDLDFTKEYDRLRAGDIPGTDKQIEAILAKTGKLKPEDELNCGVCGYSTCRAKAWAVLNGYADIDMCLPYMRKKAESMSYEIIQNSPNGIIVVDSELKIVDINAKAMELGGMVGYDVKGKYVVDYFEPTDFVFALNDEKNVIRKKMYIPKTKSYVELSITYLKEHKTMFAIMKDITSGVNYSEKLNSVKQETFKTTDEVINKQMRVVQEIASLLGETTAESKVALLKLKKTLQEEEEEE